MSTTRIGSELASFEAKPVPQACSCGWMLAIRLQPLVTAAPSQNSLKASPDQKTNGQGVGTVQSAADQQMSLVKRNANATTTVREQPRAGSAGCASKGVLQLQSDMHIEEPVAGLHRRSGC